MTERARAHGFVVYIIGAGKVGTALSRALRQAGATVSLRPRRKGLPRACIDADLLILAVRDGDVASLSMELAARRVSPRTAVVHCSGLLGPDALQGLSGIVAGTGQMHPMIAFASGKFTPPLRGGHLLLAGDPQAVRAGRVVARLLGMVARRMPQLDRAAYHAAAALVANGSVALAAAGESLLVAAGIARPIVARMLGPLLASVAANVCRMGLPEALTGPVRRGDVSAIGRHRASIRAHLPAAVPLFEQLVRAQIPMARCLGEATPKALATIQTAVD